MVHLLAPLVVLSTPNENRTDHRRTTTQGLGDARAAQILRTLEGRPKGAEPRRDCQTS